MQLPLNGTLNWAWQTNKYFCMKNWNTCKFASTKIKLKDSVAAEELSPPYMALLKLKVLNLYVRYIHSFHYVKYILNVNRNSVAISSSVSIEPCLVFESMLRYLYASIFSFQLLPFSESSHHGVFGGFSLPSLSDPWRPFLNLCFDHVPVSCKISLQMRPY